jgi:hypothetical protein
MILTRLSTVKDLDLFYFAIIQSFQYFARNSKHSLSYTVTHQDQDHARGEREREREISLASSSIACRGSQPVYDAWWDGMDG